ncbi:protein FAM161B [Trematomus bernacchii]|uniref:protein FAM161B n=1 Tax=Trematomus bernacchii TaxID=40690 RepID=UPI00146D1ECB|nr:protein FAM161B [Trematomus bernacchii]XP_033980895.1 protein FAM161B [Trematomus bernacchii]
MPKLETLLEDGLRSELMLKQHLKALSETLRQQLQETQRRQKEELERRIHQNSLLSTDVDPESRNEIKHQAKHLGMRKSSSTSALTSGKETLNHLRQSEKSFSPACLSSNWKNGSVRASRLAPAGTQCERFAVSKTTQEMREDEATAECQRKFCARPVPSHVIQPLYQEMMELKEKERKQGLEHRRDFWLSSQIPFSFQEKEKEKREKLIALINQDTEDQKTKAAAVRKPPHKEVKDPSDSRLKDQELGRQVPTQTAVPHENRTVSGSPKLRTAERNRKEKLGFLDERPSFQPKILQRVPDFSRLHKALQTEGLRKSQSKDMIKCQPFFLRTSALPARQSRTSPEKSQLPTKSNISRSKSLGALTSLSADTLPTYITDAARKRCMAIRKSMEIRDSKNEESAEWLRKHQMRSQAMKKTITLHAKLLDPHESLKEVFNDKLQHHREADQQRMRDYMKELRDMKARVSERPYLFEQVKQKNAKAHAEQTYRNTLKTAGLKEQFVEENGEVASISEEDSDENCSTEEDIPSREENVDDGEKIEDVEEKSVKSKVEEMP